MDKKVAIVTGGSRGIGAEIVKDLVKDGFEVAFTYNGNQTSAEELASTLDNQAKAYKLNVTNEDEITEFVNQVKAEYGQIDVLVNNAGVTNDMLIMKMKKADFTNVIDTNLTGSFLMSQAVLKVMGRQRSGSIINISSVVGITGNVGQANYSASKAGLIALTKSMAKEYGRRGIRVNAVAPGFIQTAMTEQLSDDIKKETLKQVALNRFGTASEVAHSVSFLASQRSSYITGQTLIIDGGLI